MEPDFVAAVIEFVRPQLCYKPSTWRTHCEVDNWDAWAHLELGSGRPRPYWYVNPCYLYLNPYTFQIAHRRGVGVQANTEADFVAGVTALLDAYPQASITYTGASITTEVLYRMGLLDHLLESDGSDRSNSAANAADLAKRRIARHAATGRDQD